MLSKKRKGIALVLTLVMCTVLITSAIMLYTSANVETEIANNTRRIFQAKTAAVSGVNHFAAMNVFYEDLARISDEDNRIVVIPETSLGDKTFYKVEVELCCELGEREFVVISTGYYKKAGQIISSHVTRSLFKTLD